MTDRGRSLAQTAALVLGAVYLLVGILGFLPPLLSGDLPGTMGPFKGNLLGIFAVNWFHSLAHLLIGAYGLAVFRSHAQSRTFTLVIGVAYLVLFLLGIISGKVGTLGGLLPLNGADDILHILTAIVLLGVYFLSGRRDTNASYA